MPRFQIIALILSGIGFALSLLLEQLHVQTHVVPNTTHFCSIGSTFDCSAVAASPYALFLGVPWAIWGALGYLALGIASYQRSRWLLPLSGLAALTSAALFILSVTVIGAVCLLCEAVHLVSIVLFVFAYRSRSKLEGDWRDPFTAATILSPSVILALSLFLFLPPYWAAFSYKSDPPFLTGKTEEGHHWIGSGEPDVTIHEYVNYRCPFCRIGTARMLRELDKNKSWRIVRHSIPPGGCPEGTTNPCHEDRMAYCSGQQGKFWRADRWLFAHAGGKKRVEKDQLVSDLALDAVTFEACYLSAAAFSYNDETYKAARAQGISAVPDYEIEANGEVPAELQPLVKERVVPSPRRTIENRLPRSAAPAK